MSNYNVVDSGGERVASCEHVEEGLALMRALPSAAALIRVNDNVTLAVCKPQTQKLERGAA